jgi:hypothetical protein
MKAIPINGVNLTPKQAGDIVRMLYEDAKQIAGEFHNMERSEKFRINWPNEYDFAESEWKNFIEAARIMYVARLAHPKTPRADAERMSQALILQAMMAKGEEADTRLQIIPNTQQFEGDRRENRLIIDKFGKRPNLRAALRNGAAKINNMLH